jgi:organic radical activating enzyme
MLSFDPPAANFCMAPWTNIHIGTMENLQPCCAGAGINYDIAQLPIYTSENNQDLLAIKKHFSQNQEPPNCQGCQERNWYSQFYLQAPKGLNDFTLLSVDLRWSNTCQLNCMYCNAAQSSSWAALEQKHSTTIPIASRIRDRDALIDFIAQHKSTIQRVSLLGGEPLLIKENIRLLELLGKDIEVNIFSGLNVDLETNAVYETLIKMPNVYWTVSMENVGEKFEFVRRGSSWSRQVKNIDNLLSNNQSRYTVNLQSQFCAYSATSMTELYEFVRARDIKINWNWLDHPNALDFSDFPDHHKLMALEQLQKVKSVPNKFSYEPQVDDIIKRINAGLGHGNQEQVARCRQWHRDIESRYFEDRLDFVALWPEFAD